MPAIAHYKEVTSENVSMMTICQKKSRVFLNNKNLPSPLSLTETVLVIEKISVAE